MLTKLIFEWLWSEIVCYLWLYEEGVGEISTCNGHNSLLFHSKLQKENSKKWSEMGESVHVYWLAVCDACL